MKGSVGPVANFMNIFPFDVHFQEFMGVRRNIWSNYVKNSFVLNASVRNEAAGLMDSTKLCRFFEDLSLLVTRHEILKCRCFILYRPNNFCARLIAQFKRTVKLLR